MLAPPPEFPELRLNFVQSGNTGPVSREEIYEDHR